MSRSWSVEAIARAEGLRAPQLGRALEDPALITPRLAAEVSKAYDQLWNAEPPRRTAAERQLAAQARQAAHSNGWAPPLAWDDDQIDKPDARPELGWQRSTRATMRTADLAEDAEFVRSAGGYQLASLGVVAERLGVTKARLEKALSRQRAAGTRERELEAG